MIILNGLGFLDNNSYILTSNKNAVLIDAPSEGNKILQKLDENKLKLKYILITHGHTDHIVSASFIRDKTGAKIIANEADMKLFLKPWKILSLKSNGFKPDILIEDEEAVKIGNLSLKIIHTPGHTQGSLCFYNEKDRCVFTGDTLFYRTIGRTDFPGGNHKQLIENIKKKLFTLHEDTTVFPGHGICTNIGDEERFFNY